MQRLMKHLIFLLSAATAAICAGVQIVNWVDPLPAHVIWWGAVPEKPEPLISHTIEAERQRHGFPKGLLEGVIFTESSFNERARNPEKSLCKTMQAKGWGKADCESRGLMGVVYGWHKDFCNLSSPADLYDPETNIKCGAKILKQKIQLANGNITAGLGLYNNDKSGRYASKVLTIGRKIIRG